MVGVEKKKKMIDRHSIACRDAMALGISVQVRHTRFKFDTRRSRLLTRRSVSRIKRINAGCRTWTRVPNLSAGVEVEPVS